MATTTDGYTQVLNRARQVLQGSEPSSTFHVGQTKIVLSKVRVLEANEPMPEPYPATDLPPPGDYGTWLK